MNAKDWIHRALTEIDGGFAAEDDEPRTAGYLLRDEATGIAVREATRSDAPALAAIGARAYRHAHGAVLDVFDLADDVTARFDLGRFRSELAESETRVLVAIWEGNEIGFAQLRPCRPSLGLPGARPLELYGLYVAPDWMGNGVGSALVRGAVALAGELGYDSLWCWVWAGNRKAIAFLEGWGFRYAGERRFQVGRTEAEVEILVRPVRA